MQQAESAVETVRTSGMPEALAQQMQALLDGLMAQKHVAHAIVAVESGDGRMRWIGAAGAATPDGAPLQVETPVFVASITKLYIAAAILKLYEQGRLDLEAPMAEYLPQTLIGGLHRLGGVDHTGSITVRNLLAHSSGLPDSLEESAKGGRSVVERLMLEGDRAWPLEDLLAIVRDDLTPHFPPQPAEAPRPKMRYSDTNYQLLMAIIEALTRQTLPEAFEAMLYRPLGLLHTFHPGAAPLEPTLPPATLWAEDRPLEAPLALESIRDLYSTVADQLKFMRALVSGAVFDDPQTFDLMRQRFNRFGFPKDRAALRSPNWPIEYGLGLMRFRLPRLFAGMQKLPAVIGHSGSTGTWLFYCPELDLYLCGAMDQITAGAAPYRAIPKVLQAFIAAAR